MNRRELTHLLGLSVAAGVLGLPPIAQAADDPLPSWRDGTARQAILDFVLRSVTPGDGFIPPEERIAVFDNDGTLWCEQPIYVQFAFALDRIKALAPNHPEWKTTEPFKSVLENNIPGIVAGGEKGVVEIIAASHAGNTTEEFTRTVSDWIATARHPKFNRPYTQLVYQPMLEVLAFLRQSGFETWIVSGGGVEFMRPWTEPVYGIPPQQVIGSTVRTKFEVRNGVPVIARLPDVEFVDDKAGKPLGINRAIGRRPVAAFGNSDGDFEMLQWTTASGPRRLAMIVHHDDAEREYAYDRTSSVGRLARALDAAPEQGWTVISMKNDWLRVFPDA
ncbi:MAG: HAD family hydrolase [Hyphomicrobiales bacterium]